MIYLDNAATTFPKPASVIKATNDCLKKYCGNPSRSSHILSLRASEAVYTTRECIAGLLHYEHPENVIFTMNATYALNIAIKTTITQRCHVILSDIEHNSVLRPIEKLKKTLGVEYSLFNTDGDIKSSIESLIRSDTKAIICTLMSNVTGKEIPLDILSEIAKRHSLTLITDASQLIGHKDIDLLNTPCDILCAPGHKALFGIPGCGFAIFCDQKCRDSFIDGGSGSNSMSLEMPTALPERFEGGSLPTPSIVSLSAGINYINHVGIDHIEKKLAALINEYRNMFTRFNKIKVYGGGGGLISFSYGDVPSELIASKLNDCGVYTRSGLHCAPMAHKKLKSEQSGLVRISASALSKERDVDKVYKALKGISRIY